MVDGEELRSNSPIVVRGPASISRRSTLRMRCSLSFSRRKANVSRLPKTGMSGRRRDEIGNGANVIFMAVGQDQAGDIVQGFAQQMQRRQDQIDSRMVLIWKQDAAVENQPLAVDLKTGAVAPDVAKPSQRVIRRVSGRSVGGVCRGSRT